MTTMAWPLEATVTLTHDDYTVAWLCALPIEKAAARNMLDELHVTPPQPEHDKNIYTFGRICGHNVVIVCQGDMGTTAASIVATRMDSTFRRLRFGLLVGIAGGVPEAEDIRLGDVVASKGDGRSGGVVAHDRGKVTLKGFESRSFLNGVPEVLRNAFSELESRLMDQDSKITTYLSEATMRNSRFSAFERPTSLADYLFQSDYPHVNSKDKTCADCAKDHIVDRPPRADSLIHFGIIASGNQVIKNAAERARISTAHSGVLAVEMEAAGLMDVFGCATIRGICDYADSHKNDGWHKYASATAAAVAKEVLGIVPVAMVVAAPPIAVVGAENTFRRPREEVDKRPRKHQLDELSTVSHTSNPNKRLKTSRSHSIDATTSQSLIDQLYFTKIDERLTSLREAKGKTCRWFLTKPEYASWHDVAQQPDHCGFLWIKGNPGTGKSTLMKLLFEEAKLNAKGDSSQITLSFFFLAQGTVEEKSTTGLYRSLLHQLFEKAEELRDSLEWMTADGARVIQRNGWREEPLKQTLMYAVQKLGSRSLTIFIDALDECDKNQATGMVCFFEELCDRAREAQVRLQICFSSRHYPTIVIEKGIEVTLEDEIGHTEDIEHYIKSRLRLGKTKSKQAEAESLRYEILEKSSRIFLWVVLVLDILSSEYPNSSVSIKKIRERLKEIPPGLTDLFEMILTRDGENLERLQVCLKWILFATRPLKPQELYFAIQLSLDKECLGFWDQEDVDLEQIKTFVRSSSKGLAEVTRNKSFEVQFIHESVRDFLLGKYEGQWSRASSNFVGHSHEILRNCCLAQLNASIRQNVEIPDPLPQASKAAELRETISLKFPFLEYSVLNVLRYANSAQQNAMEQGNFLADFPLQQWIFLNNTLEKYDIRRYKESVSLLYILAEKNLADLIRIHPQRESCFDVENERYGLPIFAALATGSHKAVQTFLEVQAEIQPQEPLLHHLCKQYSENKNKRTNFGRKFTFSRQSVFSHVAEQGDEVILTFLCASGKLDIESKDRLNRTPLSWAAENGHEAVVKLLLEKGAELDAKDQSGRTPLFYAAGEGHEAVVKLLLEKGAELDAKDQSGQTPLFYAAGNGHDAVAKLLLEKGAELDAKDNYGPTPLLCAAGNGHEAVVKLLLEKGAEPDAKENSSGRTPLFYASKNGHEAVAKLLLEKGVELEAKDKNSGQTPLSWAAENGHEAVVKLLLEKGVELEAKEKNSGQTPLFYAAKNGHEAVVKLLLEKGVELEANDKSGQTPLFYAAKNGHEAVVKLLLEKGAKLDAKDYCGRTPLSCSARNGNEAVVKLLQAL